MQQLGTMCPASPSSAKNTSQRSLPYVTCPPGLVGMACPGLWYWSLSDHSAHRSVPLGRTCQKCKAPASITLGIARACQVCHHKQGGWPWPVMESNDDEKQHKEETYNPKDRHMHSWLISNGVSGTRQDSDSKQSVYRLGGARCSEAVVDQEHTVSTQQSTHTITVSTHPHSAHTLTVSTHHHCQHKPSLSAHTITLSTDHHCQHKPSLSAHTLIQHTPSLSACTNTVSTHHHC